MSLTTKYLGKTLRSPIVVAASPLAKDVANIKKMEDSGAGAVVLHSLFEEQIRAEAAELGDRLDAADTHFAEISSFFPKIHEYRLGPDEYLKHVEAAKRAVDIPIIASLNGSTHGGWTDYAQQIEKAGADAVELNIYGVPTELEVTGAELEEQHLGIAESVRRAVKIPVAVKLSPYYSNLANFSRRLGKTGINGLVLFNRFMQPDVDVAKRTIQPRVTWSTPEDQRLPLRWVAILKGRVDLNLAATGGIHEAEDVIKGLMVGADVTMMCSSLMTKGIGHLRTVTDGVTRWLDENGFGSVDELRGSLSQQRVSDPSAFERAQFVKAVGTY